MYREMTIGVVVPAYNEEGYVGAVIEGIPEYVDRVYVVDDGSTDGTWDEIQTYARERNERQTGRFDRLVVPIQHDRNRGVGGAIKTGYQRAQAEEIDATAVLGGDDQMNPEELQKYFDPLVDSDAEYVKGNRFSDASDWADMPRFRLFGNVVLSYLTKIASGYWGMMDSQNGYTVISLAALEETDIEGMYEYYGYCNDLLVRLNEANVTIADIPRRSEFAYSGDWKSHIDYREYIPRVSRMLARSFAWRLRRKYVLKEYNTLVPLYLLGLGGTATSLLGLAKALLGRSDQSAGTWVVAILLSLLVTVEATERDRRDNEHLEAHVTERTDGDERTARIGGDDQTERTDNDGQPESAMWHTNGAESDDQSTGRPLDQ